MKPRIITVTVKPDLGGVSTNVWMLFWLLAGAAFAWGNTLGGAYLRWMGW